ncbi:hypothetical protein ACHQM5_030362 [Ranunculus cassubicifolius]
MNLSEMNDEQRSNAEFLYNSPIQSNLETKLKQLLDKLTTDGKIIGIQVCAYKDGEVVIDSVAGVLGEDDPRPVKHDSLFPVFSVTKGITAGMLHWVIDHGKLKLDENVSTIWPGFGINGKDLIKVHHALNHTSGLHNAMPDTMMSPKLSNWNECLNDIVVATPESEPGHTQLYHYSSFGWLCGGIIEHASGKKFQDVLQQAIVQPLDIEGELYIGIPPGVESRLASLTPDTQDFILIQSIKRPELPSTFQPSDIAKNIHNFCKVFNGLEGRQAIVPAANGHVTARALARYYATLASGGIVPPPYPSSNKDNGRIKIYQNPKIHEAFMGVGDYADFALPNGVFGLGFKRYASEEGLMAFGHSGLGGSVGFCDVKCNFAIAVTVNKVSLGVVTAQVVHLVCSELNVPMPADFMAFVGKGAQVKIN